jgi:hypothetical protein
MNSTVAGPLHKEIKFDFQKDGTLPVQLIE